MKKNCFEIFRFLFYILLIWSLIFYIKPQVFFNQVFYMKNKLTIYEFSIENFNLLFLSTSSFNFVKGRPIFQLFLKTLTLNNIIFFYIWSCEIWILYLSWSNSNLYSSQISAHFLIRLLAGTSLSDFSVV